MEWWAYLADILTFYNERVTNESYLRTAQLPESVNRLIALLGYRPQPALGAKGTLAALVNRARPVLIPQGLQIQSKPGPGKQPQIFEMDAATTVSQPDSAPALPQAVPATSLVSTVSTSSGSVQVATLLVSGRLSGVKVSDELLLVNTDFDGTKDDYCVGTVRSLTDQIAPGGKHNTQVALTLISSGGVFTDTDATHWNLQRSNATAALYQYQNPPYKLPTTSASVQAHLASVFRQIKPGDLVLIDDNRSTGANPPFLGAVTAYGEAIYYANDPGSPALIPPGSSPAAPAIPLLHTVITFQTPDKITGDATTVVVRFGWKNIGTLINPPVTTISGSSAGSIQSSAPPAPVTPSGAPAGPVDSKVLVEDVNEEGAFATIDGNGVLTLDPQARVLTPPLTTLFNLVGVSRGKSVLNEVLGSGDATVLNQDFKLQKSPVTYFADSAGVSGPGYSSTVRVWVNAVRWNEVSSFFGQSENAQVFLTREDDDGNTHVVFNARVPTGVNNVVASYRFGAGADSPDAGTLVSVLQPQPGLASMANPVAPTGGADADPASKIRTLAPQSVLTFGRAVSLDDYQTLAAGAAGVRAAQASFVFDPSAQRPSVRVWVAGDSGATDAAYAAITGAADPNRAFTVLSATPMTIWLALTYVRDLRYQDAAVRQALHDALLDPDQGLFGRNRIVIGKSIFNSDIYAVCLKVPGVVAIHNLSFNTFLLEHWALKWKKFKWNGPPNPCQSERYDPGDGNYYALPDDGAHLTLTPELPP